MTIIQKDKIDMIGYKEKDALCTLGISDHLDWENVPEHKKNLQDKINVYLEYITSGQADEYFENKKISKYSIVIYFKYRLTSEINHFITEIKNQIKLINSDIHLIVDEKSFEN